MAVFCLFTSTDRCYFLAIATHRVAEVLAADQLANRLNLESMQQIQRDKDFLDCRHRPP